MRTPPHFSVALVAGLIGCAPDTPVAPSVQADAPPAAASNAPRANYALDFTTDFVEVPDVPSLDLGASFTLEAWIKPRNAGGAAQHIVSKWNGCADASYSMEIRGGKVHSGIASCENGTQEVESASNIVNNRWQHVAITLGEGRLRIYINGRLDKELVGSLTPMNSTRPLSFGHEGPPFNGWWFDGLIDEVRVWNVTRSARQIAANLRRLGGSRTGLVGLWRFNEGTGTVARDASGNGNDGQLGGSPAPTWTTDAAPMR